MPLKKELIKVWNNYNGLLSLFQTYNNEIEKHNERELCILCRKFYNNIYAIVLEYISYKDYDLLEYIENKRKNIIKEKESIILDIFRKISDYKVNRSITEYIWLWPLIRRSPKWILIRTFNDKLKQLVINVKQGNSIGALFWIGNIWSYIELSKEEAIGNQLFSYNYELTWKPLLDAIQLDNSDKYRIIEKKYRSVVPHKKIMYFLILWGLRFGVDDIPVTAFDEAAKYYGKAKRFFDKRRVTRIKRWTQTVGNTITDIALESSDTLNLCNNRYDGTLDMSDMCICDYFEFNKVDSTRYEILTDKHFNESIFFPRIYKQARYTLLEGYKYSYPYDVIISNSWDPTLIEKFKRRCKLRKNKVSVIIFRDGDWGIRKTNSDMAIYKDQELSLSESKRLRAIKQLHFFLGCKGEIYIDSRGKLFSAEYYMADAPIPLREGEKRLIRRSYIESCSDFMPKQYVDTLLQRYDEWRL